MTEIEKLIQFRASMQDYDFNAARTQFDSLDVEVRSGFDLLIDPPPAGRSGEVSFEAVLQALSRLVLTADTSALIDYVVVGTLEEVDRLLDGCREENIDDEDDEEDPEEWDEEEEWSDDDDESGDYEDDEEDDFDWDEDEEDEEEL